MTCKERERTKKRKQRKYRGNKRRPMMIMMIMVNDFAIFPPPNNQTIAF
jgi:hypothetical protein